MPITSAMLQVAASDPDRLAIVGDSERLSYAALVRDSSRIAAAIDSLHAAQTAPPAPAPETRGIPISAISVESASAAACFVAALAGFRAVSATIDPRWPLAHRVDVVLTTGIGVVITDATDLADALAARGWGGTICSIAEFRRLAHAADPGPTPSLRPGTEAFLLLFSSGTTSRPKAFLKTRDQYRANVAVSSAHLEPLPGVATLAPGPVAYSLTLYAVIECLATGGTVHVADAFDAFTAVRHIREERITRVVAVPAVVRALADAARRDPGAFAELELVVTGGANLPAALRDELARVLPRTRLVSYYGAAEIGFIGDSRAGDGTGIAVYPGIDVEIRDAAGAPAPEGTAGTLWVRADACSDGYLARTTDAQLRDAAGWATVHDQARIAHGLLHLIGRAGDVAVTGGHKVSLPEVERAFAGVSGIAEACAVALPHPSLGSIVALVVEGDAQSVPDRAELAALAAARLAPQFIPRRWYRLDRLPRTVGGKVRRAEAGAIVAAGDAVQL